MDRGETLERTREILEERALRLALPVTSDLMMREGLEVLHFELGEERYAIDTGSLHSIARVASITPIPTVPDCFVGAANVRGAIVPLVDVARLLDPSLNAGDRPRSSFAVLLGRDRPDFGIVAEAVNEISVIPVDALNGRRRQAATAPWVRCTFQGTVVVLDGSSLARDPRLSIGPSVPC
jgi:chemotaxis signal transduction protein